LPYDAGHQESPKEPTMPETATKRRPNLRKLPLGLTHYHPDRFAEVHAAGSGIITGSGVAALFNRSRWWNGAFDYLAHVSGKVPKRTEESVRMRWGKVLEPAVIELVAEKRGWKAQRINAYASHPDLAGFLASPDALAWDGAPDPLVGEVKLVSSDVFRKEWIDPDTGEPDPPLSVKLQHQSQFACCREAERGFIGVAVHDPWADLDPIVFDAPRHEPTIRLIEQRVTWARELLDRGELPDPVEGEASLEVMGQLGAPTRTVTLDNDEARARFSAWRQARLDAKAADAAEKAAKEWFARRAMDAKLIEVPGAGAVSIAMRNRREQVKVLEAKSYPEFRLIEADGGSA
jgi:hypothetical protein